MLSVTSAYLGIKEYMNPIRQSTIAILISEGSMLIDVFSNERTSMIIISKSKIEYSDIIIKETSFGLFIFSLSYGA